MEKVHFASRKHDPLSRFPFVNLPVTSWLPMPGHLPLKVWGLSTFCQVYYQGRVSFQSQMGVQ